MYDVLDVYGYDKPSIRKNSFPIQNYLHLDLQHECYIFQRSTLHFLCFNNLVELHIVRNALCLGFSWNFNGNVPLLTSFWYNVAATRERFSNGYLLIATSGGLNQQRTGVSGFLPCFTLCMPLYARYWLLYFHFLIYCSMLLILGFRFIWFLQITDAVVVARILNATLVVPSLDHNSYWKDERYVESV